ncbi:right-handed parallel beta-helix repeat-containing protein, partial [Bartonella bovis]|uniref:right-handed parallel beta-helix repeat-containing protein n=1 Tax=Bartonella bovis TaxID=155194 RepID=UPI001304BA0F
ITGPSDEGTGVYATGMGMVTMEEVRISEVGTGVWMKNGNLRMTRGSIEFKGDYGVSLTRGNALLKGVGITGQDDKGTGVNVEGEGKMTMTDVNISGVITGVWVKNGANAILMGGEIGFKGNYGVYLDKGGAVLKNVRMTYTGSSPTADFIKVRGGTVIAKDIIITSTTDNGQGVSV